MFLLRNTSDSLHKTVDNNHKQAEKRAYTTLEIKDVFDPDDKIQPFFCIDQLNIQVLWTKKATTTHVYASFCDLLSLLTSRNSSDIPQIRRHGSAIFGQLAFIVIRFYGNDLKLLFY